MQPTLFQQGPESDLYRGDADALRDELRAFREFGKETVVLDHEASGLPMFVNEFWTRQQRAACSLHEVSYRACFKPQLPRFFIERLTRPGDLVYDPFMGRGTTVLEAALLGRSPAGCDVNPLSQVLVGPRLTPPTVDVVAARLQEIDLHDADEDAAEDEDLLVFFHVETLREIRALRRYLGRREADGSIDDVDRWIRMVATNRLTGHSSGFFSVYTLPPNQAVTPGAQLKINRKRGQIPERRDVPGLILRKTRSLLSGVGAAERGRLSEAAAAARLMTGLAAKTEALPADSVHLAVTSPPFLDVVQYAADNWLRGWFCEVAVDAVPLSIHRKVESWQAAMSEVFVELARVLAPGGYVAFEVGEVRGGKVNLEDATLPCGTDAGLRPELILINDQEFTKTANCWGVSNNKRGTNTNRVVVFQKP